uniref:Uncharacterized protein n=1 Tax=Oryza meridionalis TaxID=40149 RepID=A0A0E0DQU6_9ORYZ
MASKLVEEMRAPGIKKATRIFVARIPQSVDESKFRRNCVQKAIEESDLSLSGVQDEDVRHPPRRVVQGGYGAYNAYITAATRYAALGAPTSYDHPGPAYGNRVAQRSHEILGQEVAVDTAEPLEGGSGGGYLEPAEAYGTYGAYGSLLPYGRFSGSLGYDYGYGPSGSSSRSRPESRYRPY